MGIVQSFPTVYEYIGNGDVSLYVGSTLDFDVRDEQHRSTAEWYPLVKRFKLTRFETRSEMLKAEIELINTRMPMFNIRDKDMTFVPEDNHLPSTWNMSKRERNEYKKWKKNLRTQYLQELKTGFGKREY